MLTSNETGSAEALHDTPNADCNDPAQNILVIRDGHGSDTLKDFALARDIIAFEMAEIAEFDDVLDRMTQDSNAAVITFDNGDQLVLEDVKTNRLTPSHFQYTAGPVSFHAGTLIQTERGPIAVEELRPDDVLWTKDRGWQALRLVVLDKVTFTTRDDPTKPILIPQGALGRDLPDADLIVSPQNRLLRRIAESGDEVLVPAVKLVGTNGIRQMRGRKKAIYLNVLLERHSIIQAAGCWVESMLVTPRSLSRQTKAARRLMDHCLDMTPARRVVQEGTRPRRPKLSLKLTG